MGILVYSVDASIIGIQVLNLLKQNGQSGIGKKNKNNLNKTEGIELIDRNLLEYWGGQKKIPFLMKI